MRQALARAGYVVYCFDFCGGSPDSRSDGSTLEMSLFTEREDLEAVITMMQGLDFVDSDNLFLIGSSQGGAVSAITAAAHPEAIRGMVLLYPAFVLVQRANDMYQHAEQIPDRQFFMWMDVGRVYFEDLLGYDIYAEIPAYKNDVMLIHGDADTIVPLSGSQRAAAVYPSAELKVIPDAGHGFSGTAAQTAIDAMLSICRPIRHDLAAAAATARRDEQDVRNRAIFGAGLGPDLTIFYDDIYAQTIVPIVLIAKQKAALLAACGWICCRIK